MPRGLYAMVMAFKDEVPGQQPRGPLSKLANATGKALFSAERLDINQTVAKYSNPDAEMSKMKKGMQNIRLVSGKTRGEIELPEAAALVFPDLDRAADSDLQQQGKGKEVVNESTKEKWKGAGKWVQDYLDRKAQASYVSPGHSMMSCHKFANAFMIRRENTKAHLLPFQQTRGRPSPRASATPIMPLTAGP